MSWKNSWNISADFILSIFLAVKKFNAYFLMNLRFISQIIHGKMDGFFIHYLNIVNQIELSA